MIEPKNILCLTALLWLTASYSIFAQNIALVRYHTLGELDSAIVANMEKDKLPGLQIAVKTSEGNTIRREYGMADLTDSLLVTKNTCFSVFSITKLFTAVAIMQLVDKDQISLEQPVKEFLPYFGEIVQSPCSSEVTVRNLLTHTSGLNDKEWKSASWFKTEGEEFPTAEEFTRKKLTRYAKLKTCPGRSYHYSNLGFILLANIVSSQTGMAFEEYVQDSILIPLKMTDTWFNLPYSPHHAQTALGYEKKWSFMAFIYRLLGLGRTNQVVKTRNHIKVETLYPPHRGYIGIKSTATDLIKLLDCLASGTDCQILSPGAIQAMLCHQYVIDENRAMGLAWQVRTDFAGKFYRHLGGGPGFGGEVRIYESGLQIALLGNSTFKRWDYVNLIAYNRHLFR